MRILMIRNKFSLRVSTFWIGKSIYNIKQRKGYIDIDDLKKLNAVFNNHFNEDDLEGNNEC